MAGDVDILRHTDMTTSGSRPGGGSVRTRVWIGGQLQSENFPLTDVSTSLHSDGALVWVDLLNPDRDVIDRLADELGHDHRAVEDVVENTARTKADRYATHTFLTVYATALGPQVPGSIESRLLTARVSIIVLPTAVVTVRHEPDPVHPVLDINEVVRQWDDNADLLRKGSPALLHGILDVVVDGQFDTIQQLDDAIESLEDRLFDDRSQTRQLQRDTYRLRKELVEVDGVLARHGHHGVRDQSVAAGRSTQHDHEEADRLGCDHRGADARHRLVRAEHPVSRVRQPLGCVDQCGVDGAHLGGALRGVQTPRLALKLSRPSAPRWRRPRVRAPG